MVFHCLVLKIPRSILRDLARWRLFEAVALETSLELIFESVLERDSYVKRINAAVISEEQIQRVG